MMTPNWAFTGVDAFREDEVRDYLLSEIRTRQVRWSALGRCLLEADRCLVPSLFAKRMFEAVLPSLDVEMAPPPEQFEDQFSVVNSEILARQEAAGRVRVGVVGDIGPHKGSETLEAFLGCLDSLEYKVEVHHFGKVGFGDSRVTCHGSFDRSRIRSLLLDAEIGLGLLLSSAPETYSYALSDLMSANLPLVASSVGAISERVKGRRSTVLLDELSPTAVRTAIDSLVSDARARRLKS